MNNLYIIGAVGLVVGYFSYVGLKALVSGKQDAELAEVRAVLHEELPDDVMAEFERFDEWEQHTILAIAGDVKSFKKIVWMWRPDS